MEKLKGIDFSHYQPNQYDVIISDADFLIHKITEGTRYKDPECLRRLRMFADNKPTIVYHFIRDLGDIEEEVTHFLATVINYGYSHTIGVALDYELNNTKADVDALEYGLTILEKRLHKKPILYCSDLHKRELYQMLRSHDYGLWIARYRKIEPEHACDFWQYTSKPYDQDVFYGGMDKMMKYIKEG